jgi:hypothetical protein
MSPMGCTSDDAAEPSGVLLSPEVVDRVGSSNDCVYLQEQFDIADQNQAINRERSLEYMHLADDRMKEIGCYDE